MTIDLNPRQIHLLKVAVAFMQRYAASSELLKVEMQMVDNSMDYRTILPSELSELEKLLGKD